MKIKLMLASLAVVMATGSAMADGHVGKAIDAAKAAHKAAKEAGFEWRDTSKMIKEAEAAAKDGKEDKALELAKAAELQGNMGVKQAELAKTAGPRF